ncbi:spinster family MFS transporter [Henriciella aquimarina]|uniref:spinster family MFS transporter n=1 Tax=Henriciella aquimarina TaxID=545261 RepID=UPI0009FD0B33|nr:MFS transporter [Henriciella aquimarina]
MAIQTGVQAPQSEAAKSVSKVRRNLTLALIGLVAIINYVDRQAFTVLMEDIKTEFVLNDTVLGLIGGLVFGVVYALAALPIARIADRTDRPLVISICLAFWSLATAACGLAANAWHIAIARMGIAIGESGSGPAGIALASEIFPGNRRVLVLGTIQAASSIGLSVGVVLTAWLASFLSWRHTFMAIGLPGLLLAFLVYFIAAEPRRKEKADRILTGEPDEAPVPLGEAIRIIVGTPALRWLALLCIAVPMTGFGFLMWGPSFLQRVHGFNMQEVTWFGWAILAGLVSGNLTAGWLGDRYGAKHPRFNAILAASGLLFALPFAAGFALLPNGYAAIACFVVLKFAMTLWMAPTIALTFTLVPIRMRATINSLMNAIVILSGVGFGFIVAGALSDAYNQAFGNDSLRYALLTMSVGLVIGAFACLMAARSVRLAKARDEAAPG